MGINSFIKKICVQTAVYWGNPTDDGYGGFTYNDPVEIKVRWSPIKEIARADNGSEFISRAKILTPEELDYEGFLLLGTLNDLPEIDSSDPAVNPKNVPDAYMIRKTKQVFMIKSTTQFVRTVVIG